MYIYALIGERSQVGFEEGLLLMNIGNLNHICVLILKRDKINI